MVNPVAGRGSLVLDLVQRVGAATRFETVSVPLRGLDADESRVVAEAWCDRTGHQVVSVDAQAVVVRKGPRADPLAGLDPSLLPGTRLWLYTNFDCNLACDYCCAKSSPQADRRALGVDVVRRLAGEAVEAGVSELILTGGEPFLLPELVAACTDVRPTTLLTNGMLLRGGRLERLRRMDRARLTLQISLDSATPDLHDLHRGRGSWARAVAGIRTAREEDFRVKVAATLAADDQHGLSEFHDFLEAIGVPREDHLIRTVAHRGFAASGVELTLETLVPEVTVTADGVYWHPVSADHDDQLVSRSLFPLAEAIDEVRRRFVEMRTNATASAQFFPCA
jgi:uncharacterized Fe-S cluster-containing radical SAM superfamily protein